MVYSYILGSIFLIYNIFDFSQTFDGVFTIFTNLQTDVISFVQSASELILVFKVVKHQFNFMLADMTLKLLYALKIIRNILTISSQYIKHN